LQVFINPRIINASSEKISFGHGCLSALDKPGGLVATYRRIEYEAYDENGKYKTERLDGLESVIFQHKFCHLLGSLYLDHAKSFMDVNELRLLFETGKLKLYEPANEDIPLLLEGYSIGESINSD